jgi:hypothetical protein
MCIKVLGNGIDRKSYHTQLGVVCRLAHPDHQLIVGEIQVKQNPEKTLMVMEGQFKGYEEKMNFPRPKRTSTLRRYFVLAFTQLGLFIIILTHIQVCSSDHPHDPVHCSLSRVIIPPSWLRVRWRMVNPVHLRRT